MNEESSGLSEVSPPTELMDAAQLQHMVLAMFQQVQHHDSILIELQALKDKVSSLEKKNISLQSETEFWKEKFRTSQLLNSDSDGGIPLLPAKNDLKTSNDRISPNNGPTASKLLEKGPSSSGSS